MLSNFSRRLIRLRRLSTAVKEKPVVVDRKTSGKRWEQSGLIQLEKELKDDRARYSRLQQRRASHAELMRFAAKEDVGGLLAVAEANLRSKVDRILLQEERDTGTDVQTVVALSLLLSSRIVARNSENGQGIDETAVAGLSNLITILSRGRPNEDVKECLLLLCDTLDAFGGEGTRAALCRIRPVVHIVIDRLNFGESKVTLSKEERDRLERRAYEWGIKSGREKKNGDEYQKEVRLTQSLTAPFPEDKYLANPFEVGELNETNLMTRLSEQLERDRSPWLEVPNVFLSTREEGLYSAEKMIEGWKWKEAIEKELEKEMKETRQNRIRSLFSTIQLSDASSSIHKAVMASLGQGQSLLSLTSFEQSLAHPIMALSHDSFVRKMELDDNEIISSVFLDYSRFFTDPSISRTTNHRQWWAECARKQGLSPSFEVPLRRFDYESICQLGEFLTKIVFEACKYPCGKKKLSAFSTKTVTVEEDSLVREEGRFTTSKMLSIESSLVNLLQKHQFDFIVFPSWQLPMIVPPRPWIDRGAGGPSYTTSNVEVIRNLGEFPHVDMNHEMRKRLKNDSQGRPVFDALNCLGSTAWMINRPVLNVLKELFTMSCDPSKQDLLNSLSIPLRGDSIPIPDWRVTHGEEAQMLKEQWREYHKMKDQAIKSRNEHNSLWYWMLYRLVLAEYFTKSTLFFPHNMDFRGRVYPVSPLLNHMGDDVNRSLLRFARGKALGPNGLSWLKLHCINLTGKLKRNSVKERMEAADMNIDLMVDSAERPLNGEGWWKESEEPWQTLAACIEVRDALKERRPEEFVSHLPVHQDGSCNGLQHYAALGRDRGGGAEVNLLPAESPSDVYSSVAARVEQRRKADEERGDETAKKLREKMPGDLPRKVIKQTVMTTVYGVTMYGAVQQIRRQLKALGMDGDEAPAFSSYLAKHTFSSLSDAFTSSMQIKDWLRHCAKGVGELMRPVEWVTPLGLPVMQPYLRHESRKKRLVFMPITTKQMSAFPPNLVHSLDSTHMMLTALHSARQGFTFAAVHDCFWTHAADVDVMGRACREQFVALHQEDLIDQCSRQLKDKYLPLLDHPEDRKKFENLFSPKVAPGELDIRDVLNSVYFFS